MGCVEEDRSGGKESHGRDGEVVRTVDEARVVMVTIARPRLSIGLPVYNGARYMGECIRSILEQSFWDFELIICDNASTDDTAAIARCFADGDGRVRYLRNGSNLGAARNFNLTFESARARYFKWACADDVLADGFLEDAMREFEHHPEMVLCYGMIALIDAAGNCISRYEQGLDLRSESVVDRYRRAREHSGYLNVLQGIMRSDALGRSALMGGFPGSDEILMVELSLHGTFREMSRPMLYRRMHMEAASASRTVEEVQEHLDPRCRGRFAPRYWRRSYGHMRAAVRAPLPAFTRLYLLSIVLRSMIQGRDHLAREIREGAGRLCRCIARTARW